MERLVLAPEKVAEPARAVTAALHRNVVEQFARTVARERVALADGAEGSLAA